MRLPFFWRRARLGLALVVCQVLAAAHLEAQCTGCANASFVGGRSYDLPNLYSYASPIAVGDFNNDGYLDVVVYDGSSALQIFLGTPTGSFGSPIRTTTSFTVQSLAVADFDGDGNLDVVATSSFGPSLYLFRGNGTGALLAPTTISAPSAPLWVAAGDFNGDGRSDLAYVAQSGSSLTMLFGTGTGSFGSPRTLPVGPSAGVPVVADLNGDGISDIVVPNSGGGSLSVVLGTSSGVFPPPSNYPIGGSPVAVAVADFNGDGRPDLAVSNGNYSPFTVNILLGSGGGTFTSAGTFSTTAGGAIVAGDFNGDGVVDLIVGGGSSLLLYIGNGIGGFGLAASSVGTVSNPRIAVADFNRDGIPDLAVANPGFQSLTVFLSSSFGGLNLSGSVPISLFYASSLAVGHFGDGFLDLAVAGTFSGAQIYRSDAAGNLTPSGSLNYSGNIAYMATGDFNRDGRTDIAIVDNYAGKVAIFLGNGTTFADGGRFTVGAGPVFAAVADLNGDGIPDLIVANSGSNSISTLLGVGNGSFQAARSFSVGSSPVSIAVADFNRDGKIDVVVANAQGSNIALLLGDGAGGFSSLTLFPTASNPAAVASADFDGDGKADVAVLIGGSFSGSPALVVFRGDGSGGLGPPTSYSLSGSPSRLLALDLNGDSRPDLVIGGSIPGGLAVRMNDGGGGFAASTGCSVGYSAALVAADFDGDGLPDLVSLASYNPSSISILLNTSCKIRHLGLTQDVPVCDPVATPFSTQPAVAVLDDGGNVITCASGVVSASIVPGTGTPGAILGGTTSASLSAGAASFTNLSIGTAGARYQIQASHPQAGLTRTRSFSVGGPSTVLISGPTSVCTGQPPTYDAGPSYDSYSWTLDGISAGTGRTLTLSNPSVGPHTVAVQVNAAGCIATGSKAITVSTTPATPVATNNGPILPGQTLQLFASTVSGASYSWTGPNGFTSTLQNPTIANAPRSASGTYTVVAVIGACASAPAATTAVVATPTSFHTVTPCRVIDTRNPDGPLGGPALVAGGIRVFTIAGQCGIPPTAQSVSVNLTITQPAALGDLRLYPGGSDLPLISTINYRPGQTRANNEIISLGATGDLAVACDQAIGRVHFILDVNGYFQ